MKQNFSKINLNNTKIKLNNNLEVDSKKINNSKYNLTFREKNFLGVEQQYTSTLDINKEKEINKSFLENLFKEIKEKFLKGLAILSLSITLLSSCSTTNINNTNSSSIVNNNISLNESILKNDYYNQKDYLKGEINYINLFNDFNSDVYQDKNTARVTISNQFKEFVNSNGNVKIDKLINYINENKNNLNEIFNIDFTIFQKGFLYEMIYSKENFENNYGDLGNRYINFFKENYGENFETYSYNEIINKKVLSIRDFINDYNYNGDISGKSSIYITYVNELGNLKGQKPKKLSIKELNIINNKLLEIANNTNNKELKEQVLYAEYIKNNLVFLLTKSPKIFIDDLLSNGTTFEIGYGDKNYIDMSGTFTFNPESKVNYSKEFKNEIKELNNKLSKNNVEIILDKGGILIAEKGKVLAPLDLKNLENYFKLNPNSELKKILINSTLLSDYLSKNYYKEKKTNDKDFFIKGIQKNVENFRKTFNLTKEEINSIFKYGDINGGKKIISLYGNEIDLTKSFNNKYNIDYQENIFLNTANFGTIIHEIYHVYHLKYVNQNINHESYNFIDSINTSPYSSNYSNDDVYKTIMKELFYKAYLGNISNKDLDNFSYYSLSTFNYFEFISELGSGYFLYPLYNEYLKDNYEKSNSIYFKIIEDLNKNINFTNK